MNFAWHCSRSLLMALGLVLSSPANPLAAQSPKPEDKPADEPARKADKPITADRGPVGKLLEKWYAEGTAAGNIGDLYDNRDREHSELNRTPYPQLAKWQYTPVELQQRQDWALFGGLRPGIVFGNSSTSAGAHQGGSNPRRAYTHARGLEVLYRQYRGNNLYMYPEHRDHDPGHNGVNDGYGDLYPTNTPFVIISQGSSGSDQPFMRAIPFTLAAFRPEVKKKLAETGLLMPTVQMILRMSGKQLTEPSQYLTGKAHPTVFEGSNVNDLKMVEMAHEITLEDLPPIALLKVQEEETPVDGRDFFEPGATEKHVDTPVVVARIFRGKQQTRRMLVSAEESLDVNKRPLTWHWVVLRGDPRAVTITPKNEAGSVAEIKVGWHDRLPIAKDSPIESNRVDIGVFAHNGKYYSAPSFITWYFLDHEDRHYRGDGKIKEIGYKTGETEIKIADWNAFFALLKEDARELPAKLLRRQFKPMQIAELLKASDAYRTAAAAVAEAKAQQKLADAARDKAASELKAAEIAKKTAEGAARDNPGDESKRELEKADAVRVAAEANRKDLDEVARKARQAAEALQKQLDDLLKQKREPLGDSIESLAKQALGNVVRGVEMLRHGDDPHPVTAWFDAPEGQAKKGAYAAARNRLVDFGMLEVREGKADKLLPLDPALKLLHLSRFEQAMLARFEGEVLMAFYPNMVRSEFRVNYVPPELAEPPAWRDVYRYDEAGNELGWTRYGDKTPVEFTADGHKVLTKDDQGRPLTAQSMKYQPEEAKQQGWPRWRTTLQLPGNQIHHYAYSDEKDLKGKIERSEPVEEKKEPAKKD